MILLDTHVLFWAGGQSGALSKDAAAAIRRERRSDGVAASAISIWELALLFSRGKIQGSGTIEMSIRDLMQGITILPITLEIAAERIRRSSLVRTVW